ncbi:DUF6756 family protein [Kroppenstedtia sanguinis]|uniref:DUF6756 family protein n=1 Tax=Kroppenstedtia sanguinis TaxID=1380684 RepID=A0ABW4CC29_9BACL
MKRIVNYRGQVIKAAEKYRIRYEEILPENMNQIRQRVLEKFVDPEGRKKVFFWEDLLPPRVSVLNEEAWSWVEEFVDHSKVILFFNDEREDYGFYLFSGSDLVEVLSETNEDEFYLTDPELSYLLCFNHHDHLLSSGEAVSEWLSKYKTSEYDLLTRYREEGKI